MRINQNIGAFNAYRNLSVTNTQMGKSLEKLSSGFRINRAADDAAGLVRSEGLRAEIGGTKVAIRNAQDGVSFVQTAEGALEEVHSILQRMRDLAVSAANSTSDGVAEEAEVDQLRSELTAIGQRTTFNGDAVFGASARFQVGAGAGSTANSIAASVTALSAGALGADGVDVTSAGFNLATDSAAASAISRIDSAIASVSSQRSTLGATQNRLESSIRNLSVASENLSAAESRIRDTDMAEEMVKFTRHQILVQAGTAMLAQANQAPQSVLSLLR
jgi:flagellin